MIAAGDALAQDERGRQNRKRKELVALSIAHHSLHQRPHQIRNHHHHHGNGGEPPPKDWLKNPDAPAMKREAEEEWGR